MIKKNKILITGGLGFIGVHLLNKLLSNNKYHILNLDKISYASNKNLIKISNKKNYSFKKIDICNYKKLRSTYLSFHPDIVIHLAAESHVDRSIKSSKSFFKSNLEGTFNLLDISRDYFENIPKFKKNNFIFFYISTDEVYGDVIVNKKKSIENDLLKPSSPYSSTKASSELLIQAWSRTYKIPFLISRTSNNFGPFQNKEKFIPSIINSLLNNKPVKVYGNGKQIRDWIFVQHNVEAIILILQKGKKNNIYNISSGNSLNNINLINIIYKKIRKKINFKLIENYIEFIDDRPGHDKKYNVSSSKIKKELGWKSKNNFLKDLDLTIDWYLNKYKDN